MIWLSHETATTTSLPAAWVIATGASPANLPDRSALRRDVARRILARQLGIDEAVLTISHDVRGRPLLSDGPGPALQISLATRAGHVALALAQTPVGVDVERIDPDAEMPLATLHPRERDALLALPASLRPRAFAQIWCVKEAYVKALGLGFLRAPESFCVVAAGGNEGRFMIADPLASRTASGHSRIIENGDQEILAAAMVTID